MSRLDPLKEALLRGKRRVTNLSDRDIKNGKYWGFPISPMRKRLHSSPTILKRRNVALKQRPRVS